MASSTVYLSVDLMREIIHRLAKSFFSEYKEPIPDFEKHNAALLDSALSLPKATYGGLELYPTLADKSAVMFYAIIKNHAFANGNKRIATTALLVFLYLNGQWLESEQQGIYEWAVKVAESSSQEREKILQELTKWLQKNLTAKNKTKSRGLFRRIWVALSWLVPIYWYRRKKS